jgi:phospholipid/cholesterol/gamma-HCH transport system substrate-binding protein
MDERRLEIKVGALLVAALVSGAGLLALMGELPFGRGGARLRVLLEHTGNVVRGAPVKLGGVVVGKVDRIALDPERRGTDGRPLPVELELAIDSRIYAALHQDAEVSVATVGPLGEAYLEVSSGSAGAAKLPPDATLRGNEVPRFDVLMARAARFSELAEKLLGEDPRAISELAGSVASLTRNVDGILSENRAELRSLLVEASAAVRDLRAAAAMMKSELPPVTAEAKAALGGLAKLSSGLTAEDGARVRKALESVAGASAKLDSLAQRGDQLLARIESGQGTVGAAIKDPQLYDDLRALLSDLRAHPWKLLWKK